MASVSELSAILSMGMKRPYAEVYHYARRLIDAGLLPKSRGRAIEQVDLRHTVRLLLAVALSPAYQDTASVVRKYCGLRRDGVPDTAPPQLLVSAEERLCDIFVLILAEDEQLTEEERSEHAALIRSEIEIVSEWPEIGIYRPDHQREVFKRGLAAPGRWEGKFKKSMRLSGLFIDELGDYGLELQDLLVAERNSAASENRISLEG